MRAVSKTILFFIVLFSACTNGGESTSGSNDDMMSADKICYTFYAGSVAPQYYRGYTICITAGELKISINSYSDTLLRKTRDFTREEFEKAKERFKNFKESGEIDKSRIPDGGTSQSISFYKKGQLLFEGNDYQGGNKNFKGADIDLSYLVPDLEDLIDSTKDEKKQDDKDGEDDQNDYDNENN